MNLVLVVDWHKLILILMILGLIICLLHVPVLLIFIWIAVSFLILIIVFKVFFYLVFLLAIVLNLIFITDFTFFQIFCFFLFFNLNNLSFWIFPLFLLRLFLQLPFFFLIIIWKVNNILINNLFIICITCIASFLIQNLRKLLFNCFQSFLHQKYFLIFPKFTWIIYVKIFQLWTICTCLYFGQLLIQVFHQTNCIHRHRNGPYNIGYKTNDQLWNSFFFHVFRKTYYIINIINRIFIKWHYQ